MKEKTKTIRWNFLLTAGLLALLVLTACEGGADKDATINKSINKQSGSPPVTTKPEYRTMANATPAAGPKAAVNDLKQHLTLAREAASAGDFAKAKQHYADFHNAWDGPIEKAMEKDANDAYEIMEQGEKKVGAALNNTTTPNKQEIVEGIDLQIKALDAYAATLK